MKIQIELFVSETKSFIDKGYIEMDSFDAEECWNMCNWSCYSKEKPPELFSDVDFCDHGICFTDPITGLKHLAKSIGFKVGTVDEVLDYAIAHMNKSCWF